MLLEEAIVWLREYAADPTTVQTNKEAQEVLHRDRNRRFAETDRGKQVLAQQSAAAQHHTGRGTRGAKRKRERTNGKSSTKHRKKRSQYAFPSTDSIKKLGDKYLRKLPDRK